MRKLTDEQVRLLRERRAKGASQYDLAEDFGVAQATVSQICSGARRPDAGGPIDKTRRHFKRRPS